VVDTTKRKTKKHSEINLSQSHFIHHESHMDWLRITLGSNPGLISPYPSHQSASSVCLGACVQFTCDCDEKCVYKQWEGSCSHEVCTHTHTHTHACMHSWTHSCQAYVSFT